MTGCLMMNCEKKWRDALYSPSQLYLSRAILSFSSVFFYWILFSYLWHSKKIDDLQCRFLSGSSLLLRSCTGQEITKSCAWRSLTFGRICLEYLCRSRKTRSCWVSKLVWYILLLLMLSFSANILVKKKFCLLISCILRIMCSPGWRFCL